MFYYYFRVFNWICSIFGFIRPHSDVNGKICVLSYWFKIWTIVVIFCNIILYTLNIDGYSFNIKKNLPRISEYNDLITNIFIVSINLVYSNNFLVDLYETIINIFGTLKINNMNLKWIALKLYFWFGAISVLFVTLIVIEIVKNDFPLMLVMQIPTFLTVFHLFTHLYLILSVLKVVSCHLLNMLDLVVIKLETSQEKAPKASILKYLFSFEKGFIHHNNPDHRFDIKELCIIYDDINVCITLLEKHHGFQILLIIWSMFSSTVFGVTIIACKQVEDPTLMVIKCALPFAWCFLCCFVDDQLRKEVEVIDTAIVKHIIDYRCDRSRRNILQNFKQLVSTERLDFTACNLFHLNYSMLLGTIVNIITYSIILIQLFVSG